MCALVTEFRRWLFRSGTDPGPTGDRVPGGAVLVVDRLRHPDGVPARLGVRTRGGGGACRGRLRRDHGGYRAAASAVLRRAPCRARACQFMSLSVAAVSLNKTSKISAQRE